LNAGDSKAVVQINVENPSDTINLSGRCCRTDA
jgi:hypothetical protein